MENTDKIQDLLISFDKKPSKDIPPILEEYLRSVAKTGKTLFPWHELKTLLVKKLEQVMDQFNKEDHSDRPTALPNVENTKFEDMRIRIIEALKKFNGAPFTVQRICELVMQPKKNYTQCDKFLRGIEKNVMIVSTVDPYGSKIVSESSRSMVNGLDMNGDDENPDREDLNDFTDGQPFAPILNLDWTGGVNAVWPNTTALEKESLVTETASGVSADHQDVAALETKSVANEDIEADLDVQDNKVEQNIQDAKVEEVFVDNKAKQVLQDVCVSDGGATALLASFKQLKEIDSFGVQSEDKHLDKERGDKVPDSEQECHLKETLKPVNDKTQTEIDKSENTLSVSSNFESEIHGDEIKLCELNSQSELKIMTTGCSKFQDGSGEPFKRHEAVTDQFQGPPERHEAETDQFQGSPERHKAVTDQIQGPPERHEAETDQFQGPPERHEAVTDQIQGPPERHEAETDQFQGPPEKKMKFGESEELKVVDSDTDKKGCSSDAKSTHIDPTMPLSEILESASVDIVPMEFRPDINQPVPAIFVGQHQTVTEPSLSVRDNVVVDGISANIVSEFESDQSENCHIKKVNSEIREKDIPISTGQILEQVFSEDSIGFCVSGSNVDDADEKTQSDTFSVQYIDNGSGNDTAEVMETDTALDNPISQEPVMASREIEPPSLDHEDSEPMEQE